MLRRTTFALFLLVLATALMPVRVGMTYVHLCMDGQEPALSLHVQELPTHHDLDVSADGHNDLDLDASDLLPARQSDDVADLGPTELVASVVVPLQRARRIEAPAADVAIPPGLTAFDLRPPSRGPPA